MSLQVNIRKKLQEFELHIEFETDSGCLGILGASGCGKSMTLKSIAGIVTPDEGQIVLDGRVLFDSAKKIDLKPQQRRVGYLFQNYALFPNMTVEQNIRTGLAAAKMSKEQQKKRAAEMIQRFHLEGLERRYPKRLSGGQQQRVALARILAYEPAILLLDEPFSAMDAHLREGLQIELAKQLKEYQGLAVMVTHDRDEAYRLTDELMLISKGECLIKKDTRKLFENPVKTKAARLTGCKNISAARKTGEYEVFAADWGITLRTNEAVPDTLAAVGIRAHDFYPADESTDSENVFPVIAEEKNEAPFEWNVIFRCPYSQSEEAVIWWKTQKEMSSRDIAGYPPALLAVKAEKILLLED